MTINTYSQQYEKQTNGGLGASCNNDTASLASSNICSLNSEREKATYA